MRRQVREFRVDATGDQPGTRTGLCVYRLHESHSGTWNPACHHRPRPGRPFRLPAARSGTVDIYRKSTGFCGQRWIGRRGVRRSENSLTTKRIECVGGLRKEAGYLSRAGVERPSRSRRIPSESDIVVSGDRCRLAERSHTFALRMFLADSVDQQPIRNWGLPRAHFLCSTRGCRRSEAEGRPTSRRQKRSGMCDERVGGKPKPCRSLLPAPRR